MSLIITTEHLHLSASTRAQIEAALDKLHHSCPDESTLRLFIKFNSKGIYTATLIVHCHQLDFVASDNGLNLVGLVADLQHRVKTQLAEDSRKNRQLRRKNKRTTSVPEAG